MRFLTILLLFFTALSANAHARISSLRVYALNAEMRYERNEELEQVDRKPLNFGIGYQRLKFSVLAEYSTFSETTGNPTSSFERTHREMMVWGRYHFMSLRNQQRTILTHFYAGVGAGAYEEEVITKFMGDSRSDKSKPKIMTGVSAGAEFSYALSRDFAGVLALEGRSLMASDFDPNPMWGGVVRIGFAFPL